MSARYVTNTYEITDAYKKILIDAKEGNVKIEASSDDSTKLVLFEDKKRPYVFDVQNGTLTVQLQKTRWYNLLRIGFKRSEIRIYVPKSILEELGVFADETAWVGDTSTDIETSKNLGAALAIGVIWGFRKKEELVSSGADVIVSEPCDIYRAVKEYA